MLDFYDLAYLCFKLAVGVFEFMGAGGNVLPGKNVSN